MPDYVPQAGACLLIPFNDVPHLSVILNDPCSDGCCLLAMVSSVKTGRRYDPACLLNRGDHGFIRHESYMVYRLAETVRADRISNLVGRRYYLERDAISRPVFSRIASGLYTSDETRPRIIEYAKRVGI